MTASEKAPKFFSERGYILRSCEQMKHLEFLIVSEGKNKIKENQRVCLRFILLTDPVKLNMFT